MAEFADTRIALHFGCVAPPLVGRPPEPVVLHRDALESLAVLELDAGFHMDASNAERCLRKLVQLAGPRGHLFCFHSRS